MLKKLLIYGTIWEYSARDFITSLNEVEEGEDVQVNVNSDGGSPEYGWGIISALLSFAGKVMLKIDGKAHSTMMFACCYFDDVESLDISQFLVHRAAYSEWYEQNYMSVESLANLNAINKSLRAAFEAKVDVAEFEKITGKTVDDIFSMDSRTEVFLTAAQAKKIKLISSIKKITPLKKKEIDASMYQIAAQYLPPSANNKPDEKIIESNHKIIQKMTLEQIKAEQPDLFAQILAMGVAQEKVRVNALLKFHAIDSETVVSAIKDGKEFDAEMGAEFTAKAISANQLSTITAESPADLNPDEKDFKKVTEAAAETTKTEKETFQEKVFAEMGLKSK